MTPLVLVVGFLGSGKTTFLKSLVPALGLRGLRPGLVINDYQNARVDAEQFRDQAGDVRALSGDCVCCGSRDQLLEELGRFEHGPARVLVIETNGTTDSEQLIEALALEPSLRQFSLPIQLSLIDAKRWQKRFWHNALERSQARTASHVSLSRLDEVSPDRLAFVRRSLHEAGIRGSETSPDAFAAELAGIREDGGRPLQPAPHACSESCHHHHGEHHAHPRHHADHHFTSCEYLLPEAVSEKSFRAMLGSLPPEVIRAKGLVRFESQPDEFFVFQKLDEDVQFFPVGPAPKIRTPLALFIGPRLPEEFLQAAVAGLRTAAPL